MKVTRCILCDSVITELVEAGDQPAIVFRNFNGKEQAKALICLDCEDRLVEQSTEADLDEDLDPDFGD